MRRALLDTNILIWREAARTPRDDIGVLFLWLDQLKIEKYVHPLSLQEISNYHDKMVVHAVGVRAKSYIHFKTSAPLSPHLNSYYDGAKDQNTRVDILLLNELACGRVDFLITEDRGIRDLAKAIGLSGALSIAEFIEQATKSKPTLPEYRIPSIEKILIGELDFSDKFFDSLRASYPGFDRWLHRKADEYAYVLRTDLGIGAFLYLKFEDKEENYSDVTPTLRPASRLKIGTLKVAYNGFRVGERLLHIAFDAAIGANVDQLYVTMRGNTEEQERLRKLLDYWGFEYHGQKLSAAGEEAVLVRDVFSSGTFTSPFHQYPRIRRTAGHYLVPIYPAYHTELFPESILRTESPGHFVEQAPHRNAIAKAYITRSVDRSAQPGDALVFYRTADKGAGYHTSVATTLAMVEGLTLDIRSFEDFCAACRRRSIFSDEELRAHWEWKPNYRPFVVHLLHVQSFSKRPNRRTLLETGLIPDAPPRGLTPISPAQFEGIIQMGHVNERLIID